MKNNIIQEDYVSFEIAKLLEEKGFDEYCRAEWLEYIDGPSKGKTYLTECGSGLQHNSCSNTSLKKFNYDGQMYYAAPTLQMAMKWLREVHKCYMHIVPFYPKSKYNESPKWIAAVDYDGNGYPVLNEKFNTYEEACEAAIKYCLINLI